MNMKEKMTRLNAIVKKNSDGRLFIFGAGKNGKELLNSLNQYSIDVQAFIDNNRELGIVNGKSVISFNEFLKAAKDNDFVLISCAAYGEIEEQLKDTGVKNYMYYREVTDIKYIIDYDIVQEGNRTSWEKAIGWLLEHKIQSGGIAYSNARQVAYPEVTGYLIPTLVEYGYYDEAKECAKWLLSIQEDDGGFMDVKRTKEFVFDTGQILRGFLCFYDDLDIGTQVVEAIKKICVYLCANMIDFGKGGYIKQYTHDNTIPETILLYTLPPFKRAAELLEREDYLRAIDDCISFYEKQESFLDITDLTHFLAYEIEALIDLGRQEKVADILERLFASQMPNGAIPSHKNSQWICTPGTAQLALCELKLGKIEHADKILAWIRSVQMPNGGLLGSYGPDAGYFAGTEISWAVKYFLDAESLYIKNWFDSNADDFPENIEITDPRYQAVIKEVRELGSNGKKIVEVGCGKGRFLRNILEDGFMADGGQIDGIDISEAMLACLPSGVRKIHGRMEHIPCDDNMYDFVFCIEALEHSQNMNLAVSEMVRILKPQGKLVIIDKDKAYWGLMRCSVWENWIGREELKECLGKYLKEVEVRKVDEKRPYMLVWSGRK